jgi:hypothetical protein
VAGLSNQSTLRRRERGGFGELMADVAVLFASPATRSMAFEMPRGGRNSPKPPAAAEAATAAVVPAATGVPALWSYFRNAVMMYVPMPTAAKKSPTQRLGGVLLTQPVMAKMLPTRMKPPGRCCVVLFGSFIGVGWAVVTMSPCRCHGCSVGVGKTRILKKLRAAAGFWNVQRLPVPFAGRPSRCQVERSLLSSGW